jgi:hypothetical protein
VLGHTNIVDRPPRLEQTEAVASTYACRHLRERVVEHLTVTIVMPPAAPYLPDLGRERVRHIVRRSERYVRGVRLRLSGSDHSSMPVVRSRGLRLRALEAEAEEVLVVGPPE